MSGWWRPRRRWERPSARFLPATYEAHLPLVNSEALKRIARAWCGSDANRWRKEECVAALLRWLDDPSKVRRLLDSLGPYERKALGILRALGGEADEEEYALEVASLGIEPPRYQFGWRSSLRDTKTARLLNPLIGHGFLLPRWREDRVPSSGGEPLLDYYHAAGSVFSDERILRAVEPIAPAPLPVSPVEGPAEGRWRRPAEALLPVVSLVQAMRRVGPLQTRANGAPTPPAWRRLSKEVARTSEEEAASLPRTFALSLATGLAEFDPFERRILLSRDADARLRRPFPELARSWVEALRAHSSFSTRVPRTGGEGDAFDEETGLREFSFDLDDSSEGLPHAMSLRSLGRLPAIRDGWYDAEAFSEAFFERAGGFLETGLAHSPAPSPRGEGLSPAQEEKRREWKEGARKRWRALRAPRIEALIRQALFELGLVEVAVVPRSRGRERTLFRPTALGAAAMGGTPPAGATTPATAPCAVVQPNFEVVVDLGAATPEFLLFCERSARRVSAGPAAVYRLERGAACASFDSGETVESYLGTLGGNSAKGIPANVETTLRDWARRREQLVVRGPARLLEYEGRADRDAALAAGVRGSAVGERFLLLDPAVGGKSARSLARRTIDYALPPARCLEAREEGSLTLDPLRSDLLAEGEVAAFSDPHPEGEPGRRAITRESLARAKASGLRAEEILKRLEARASRSLPLLLLATVRACDGGTPFALEEAEVLRLDDLEGVRAIATSARFRPHLAGALGPDVLLVRPGHSEKVAEILLGLGFRRGAVPLTPLPEAEGPEQQEEGLLERVLFANPRKARRYVERLLKRPIREPAEDPDGP
ncbi:MAG TPA: hypothetical protein VFI25_02495 [Planctomycetota bacterium]|jgi:hypothetical protein|nr:hypothetical protein [Planctomycetota bacterium]